MAAFPPKTDTELHGICGEAMRIGPFVPYPESDMEKVFPQYTLCEVLRQIYKTTTDPAIKLKCRVAVTMAKAMDSKLREYNDLFVNSYYHRSTKEMNVEMEKALEQSGN